MKQSLIVSKGSKDLSDLDQSIDNSIDSPIDNPIDSRHMPWLEEDYEDELHSHGPDHGQKSKDQPTETHLSPDDKKSS